MKRIIFSLAIFMIIIIVGLHKIGVVFFDYNGKDEGDYDCLVLDYYKETDNKKVYKIRINNDKFLLYLNKNEKCDFEVGDYIEIFTPSGDREVFKLEKLYDEDMNLVDVARHPDNIYYLEFNSSFDIPEYSMIKIVSRGNKDEEGIK